MTEGRPRAWFRRQAPQRSEFIRSSITASIAAELMWPGAARFIHWQRVSDIRDRGSTAPSPCQVSRMNKKDSYKDRLRATIARAVSDRDDGELVAYLASNSNLPGPRGNIELAYAFAEVAAELSAERPSEIWALAYQLSLLPPSEAPVNDPREIVPFCGAVAIGTMGSSREEMFGTALARLREMSSDPRWRAREGVAMGLQILIGKRGTACLDELLAWISDDDWLAMRAAAAGVAEPSLLRDESIARAALDIHRKIIERFVASTDRKNDGFRTLRQALGYSLSVVVSALPGEGFEHMRHLARSKDMDVQWILRENLKKKRLTKDHPCEVAELTDMIAGLGPS